MLYTSYFAKKLPSDCIRIAVSNSKPDTVHLRWKTVLPSWEIVEKHKNGLISDMEYIENYLKNLNQDKDRILAEINGIQQKYHDQDVILLCWERNGKFCHRHILSYFLNNNGIGISEY